MAEKMRTFLKDWFQKLLSDSDEVQAKKVAYLLVILVGSGCLVADISLEHKITTEFNVALGILGSMVTTGYLVGKKLETK